MERFRVGDKVLTSQNVLIPNSIGTIVGLADDDYSETREFFIVDFGAEGTCTVNQNEIEVVTDG